MSVVRHQQNNCFVSKKKKKKEKETYGDSNKTMVTGVLENLRIKKCTIFSLIVGWFLFLSNLFKVVYCLIKGTFSLPKDSNRILLSVSKGSK